MQRILLPAGALALAAVAPGIASAKPPTTAHARAYERAYQQVAHHLGARVPGRNIIRNGVGHGRRATDAESVRSLHVLRRMLPPGSAPTTTATSSGAAASSSGTDRRLEHERVVRRNRPLPDHPLDGGGLRLRSVHAGRPGCLRPDHLPPPGRRRVGGLRRLTPAPAMRDHAGPPL
jgi:hypothetical protein